MKWINKLINKARLSIIFFTIIQVLIGFYVSSCSEDVLDKSPRSAFSDADVWQDEALIKAYINNTYRIVPNGWVNPGLRLAGVTDESYSRGGAADYINAGNISPASLGDLDFWTRDTPFNYWAVIEKCNVFLNNIGKSKLTNNALQDRMIGEMKFLRAYSYFRLVAFHGGVPLFSKPFSLTDELNLPRSSYDECMNFVVKELDESVNLLPLEYSPAELGKITKGAALSIKSRVLLYMASPLNNPSNDQAKWQAAADAAKTVIDLNKYSLYPDYKGLFQKVNSYNSEIIWSRPFNTPLDYETAYAELCLFPNSYDGYGQVGALVNLIDDYEMLSGRLPKDDPTYNPQNPWVNRDPRFYASILYDGAMFQGKPVETFLPKGKDSPEGTRSPHNASPTGIYVRKFIDESITKVRSMQTNNSNAPWIFVRYAEILLNYAEAKYFLGDEVTCREYINKIRSRSGVNMPLVVESGPALLARLQNERRIELVFEEHRWFDVRRWKIAPVVLNVPGKRMQIIKNLTTGIKTYTVVEFNPRAFSDKDYLVPIPQVEIDRNPLLTQNPGH